MAKEDTIDQLVQSSHIAEIGGLNQHELVALVTIAENISNPGDSVATYGIQSDMERAGYTKIAGTLALTGLLRKGMIESGTEHSEYGQPYTAYSLTQQGMSWIMNNQDRFVLRLNSEDDLEAKADVDSPF